MGRLFAAQTRPHPTGGFIIIWSGAQADIPAGWVHYANLDDRFPAYITMADFNYGDPGGDVNFRDRGHHHTCPDVAAEVGGHRHDSAGGQTNVDTGSMTGLSVASCLQSGHFHMISSFTSELPDLLHYHQDLDTLDNSDVEDIRPPFHGLMYMKGPCNAAPVGTIVLYDGPDLSSTAQFIPGDVLTSLAANFDSSVDTVLQVSPSLDLGCDGSSSANVFIEVDGELMNVTDTTDPANWVVIPCWDAACGSHLAGASVVGPLWQPLNGALGTPDFDDTLFDFQIVVGAGGAHAAGDTGGAFNIVQTHPVHQHAPNTVICEDDNAHHHWNTLSAVNDPAGAVNTGDTGNYAASFGHASLSYNVGGTGGQTTNHFHSVYNATPYPANDVFTPENFAGTGPGTPHSHSVTGDTGSAFLFWVDDLTQPAVWKLTMLMKVAAGSGADVPVGGITYRYALGGMPGTWQDCDGTNGTPNLHDRSVEGASATAATAIGQVGGDDVVNLPLHTHSPDTTQWEAWSPFGTYQTSHRHHTTSLVTDLAGGDAVIFANGPTGNPWTPDGAHTHGYECYTNRADPNDTPPTGTLDAIGTNHLHAKSGVYSNESTSDEGNQMPPWVALYHVERLS